MKRYCPDRILEDILPKYAFQYPVLKRYSRIDIGRGKGYNDRNIGKIGIEFVKFIYRIHAIERMFQRNISEADVEKTIMQNNIVEAYPDDLPYPSYLVPGYEEDDIQRPIHVVFAKNGDERIVITVYRPEVSKWSDSFKKRI